MAKLRCSCRPDLINTTTVEEAASRVQKQLGRYYTTPIVNINVDEYKANRITLLGRADARRTAI